MAIYHPDLPTAFLHTKTVAMRHIFPLAVSLSLLVLCPLAFGDDKTKTAFAEIGELNEAYVTAFNGQDAKKVAACFSPNADYTLLTGDTVRGRDMLAKAHASFFKNNPQAKVKGKQEAIRLVRPSVALAEGTWEVTGGPSEYPSSGTWYTVVAKKGKRWHYEAMRLMVSPK